MSQESETVGATPLSKEKITAALETRWLGRPIYFYPQVESTNTLLAEMAAGGEAAGTMVLTDYQSRGKGRMNRRWQAPPRSSLLLSLLFRPNWPAQQATWLTMIAGLAAVEAIEAGTKLEGGLKWPNDVMLIHDGAWHKTGGILLETELAGDQIRQAVMGMGLNVNIAPDALPKAETPATSLLAARGRTVARLPLLATFLQKLEHLYEAASAGRSPHTAWNKRLIMDNRRVRVTEGEKTLEGVATGVDEWGRLLLRDAQGKIHKIAAGDATLRG